MQLITGYKCHWPGAPFGSKIYPYGPNGGPNDATKDPTWTPKADHKQPPLVQRSLGVSWGGLDASWESLGASTANT